MIIYIIMKVTFQIVWNTTYDSSERNQEEDLPILINGLNNVGL
jgi:hypothetical protein